MKNSSAQSLRSFPLVLALLSVCQLLSSAAPTPVRHINGTMHGFLQLRSDDGKVVAAGDLVQVVSGSQVTARLLFHFTDGSTDDETTVFSQRRTFQLISYHHIQKGPSFPHPIEMTIDARTGTVTIHSTGNDGKEAVKTSHVQLPLDLGNGLISYILENGPPAATPIKVPLLVATPSPRLVTLSISPVGDESYSLAGSARKATHYEIKIELGGVAGIVAPMIGKNPPNIQVWILGGQAPAFIREQGPLYLDGPVITMELVSPMWPSSSKSNE